MSGFEFSPEALERGIAAARLHGDKPAPDLTAERLEPIAMTFLSSRQVAEKIGVKHGTIRQWRKRGKFPEPDLEPNRQTPLWAETTVDQWLEERRGLRTDQT